MKEMLVPNNNSLQDYSNILGEEIINKLIKTSKNFKSIKVVEINSTPDGGVAELMRSQIPMMQNLGLEASWYVLPENKEFFGITKQLHNCLQGQCSVDHNINLDFYDEYLKSVVSDLPPADLYILHDPQTIGLAKYIEATPMIWRCHIDTTDAHEPSYKWVSEHFKYFSEIIFSLDSFVHKNIKSKINIVQPAIDPLSEKNILLSNKQIKTSLSELGINKDNKYILQVSRFDKFKNPLGVIDLYEKLESRIENLACVLAGNFPSDDPEGPAYSKKIDDKINSLKGEMKIITKSSDTQINALQSNASVVIQNSTREGFGLTVAEAMWKKKIVFSREVGGITSQIIDNKTGFYLSNNIVEDTNKIQDVILMPEKYSNITTAAHRHVLDNFVLPVMLEKYLVVYTKALNI